MISESRLTQARGLKRRKLVIGPPAGHVAPHAGAWIETEATADATGATDRSRLTQARGLKRHRTCP